MSVAYRILKCLKDSRTSLNTHQLDEMVNHDPDSFYVSKGTIYTTMHYMISKGYLKQVGEHVCKECCIGSLNYRITEEGLITLIGMEVKYNGGKERCKKEAKG